MLPSGWSRACAFPSWTCPRGASGPIPTAGASICAPHCVLRCAPAAIPALRRRNPRRRHPPLVIICDISGSMSRYSRVVLHFMHAVTNDRDRVFSFLFGTRLTNITRLLRHRDVDVAIDRVADTVQDWSGGTRIGHCLAEFNARWSRRVLGQGAVVLFISDGLDRDSGEGLTREIERLHKSCRRLIWLNPLLRYDAYEPKSLGAQAIMPPYRRFPADPQSGEPRRVDRSARPPRPAAHGRSKPMAGTTPALNDDVLEQAAAWRQAGRGVAIATVTATWGSSPRPVGSQLVVDDKGRMSGSVSGGCIEGAVVREAQEVIAGGKPRLLDFGVTNEQAWEVGLACGGKLQIWLEALE